MNFLLASSRFAERNPVVAKGVEEDRPPLDPQQVVTELALRQQGARSAKSAREGADGLEAVGALHLLLVSVVVVIS